MTQAKTKPEWDLFISYKSEDATVVRQIVEALMAHGVRVWFAEYRVSLENYDQFQREVDAGIDGSRYALVFTRDEWAASRYCQIEMVRIAQRIPFARILRVRRSNAELTNRSTELCEWNAEIILKRRILGRESRIAHRTDWMIVKQAGDEEPDMFDVHVPDDEWPTQAAPVLESVPTLDLDASENYVRDVVEFVARHTDLFPAERLPLRRGVPESREFVTFGMRYRLDLFGWELTSPGGTSGLYGNFNGPTFRRDCGGSFIEGRIVLGAGVPALQPTEHTEATALDDRQRYKLVRDFARAFADDCRSSGIQNQTLGVHILTLDEVADTQATHGAFTCLLGGAVEPHWQRRYSVNVRHPVSGRQFEFAFTFDVFSESGENRDPRDLFQHAHWMDRVAASLSAGHVS